MSDISTLFEVGKSSIAPNEKNNITMKRKGSSPVRIAGVILPRGKYTEIALTAIYGIGKAKALEVLSKTEIAIGIKTEKLTPMQLRALRNVIEDPKQFRTEAVLRREVRLAAKRLVDIQALRGKRRNAGLPTRGQRTQTNAHTAKRGKSSTKFE
uniref:Ribosomal protein S13 n=1 Tax=Karenia mikimotoi TaxID=225107 RepID=A0A0U1V1X7_KARMI|nr:ribosomal protein S13 [Karenia mikimotoi]